MTRPPEQSGQCRFSASVAIRYAPGVSRLHHFEYALAMNSSDRLNRIVRRGGVWKRVCHRRAQRGSVLGHKTHFGWGARTACERVSSRPIFISIFVRFRHFDLETAVWNCRPSTLTKSNAALCASNLGNPHEGYLIQQAFPEFRTFHGHFFQLVA